jgi:hypothetical protein
LLTQKELQRDNKGLVIPGTPEVFPIQTTMSRNRGGTSGFTAAFCWLILAGRWYKIENERFELTLKQARE